MDKKTLLEMGLTEENATKLLKTLKEQYVAKSTLDEKDVEIGNLKKQVEERDTQIKSLEKFEGDNEQLKAKLEEMKTTNDAKTQEYNKTLQMERKKSAIRFALLEDEGGKPHDVAMVAGMFNLDNINLNEDGSIANGFKEQNETLRKEKAFLFNTAKPGTKKFGSTPPDGKEGNPPVDTPESFGARLAQTKLQQLGIKVKTED